MRVNNNNVNRVISMYNQNSKPKSVKEDKKELKDKVEISTTGKELAKYIDAAKNTEIKNSRVDEIKELVKQNKYKVDSGELADSILKHIKERDN